MHGAKTGKVSLIRWFSLLCTSYSKCFPFLCGKWQSKRAWLFLHAYANWLFFNGSIAVNNHLSKDSVGGVRGSVWHELAGKLHDTTREISRGQINGGQAIDFQYTRSLRGWWSSFEVTIHFKRGFSFRWKYGCQKFVAMVTSKLINTKRPHGDYSNIYIYIYICLNLKEHTLRNLWFLLTFLNI